MAPGVALVTLLVLGYCSRALGQTSYVGKPLGALSELHHGVRGRVFAVDSRTLFLQDFHYDGEGPAAYFYVGTSGRPSGTGAIRLRDERGGTGPLRRYRGEGVTLALPDGKTLRDVRWFAIWCDEYSVNFGDVVIPRELEYPRPAKVGALRGVHGVGSDPIVVVDAQTLLVPNFSYDGEAPDAKFWVGRGDKPSPQGIRIPDENGKETPLRKYDKKTIVLTLPGDLTVFDIGYFSVWCEAFTVNFGHVVLHPSQLANVPPSLKMLGVSPQSKLNCEVLLDELAFEVRWAVAGDSIVLQLVAKLEDGEYMSFGISGDSQHSQMVGGDVVVAWVDKQTLKGYAHDYYLDAKSQCAGVRGSCPDERLGEKTNSVRLLNAALVNGYSIVTYQRSLRAADELDRAVLTNATQPVIWALGPLNSRAEVSYHHHFTKGDRHIEFGRPPLWNCPMPDSEDDGVAPPSTSTAVAEAQRPTNAPDKLETTSSTKEPALRPRPVPTPRPVPRVTPWEIPGIQCYEPPDGVFYAQMGPTGGKQGYSAITGHVGWGISWYINGLLIPEITVVRGRRYTFVVEGGDDPDTPATYHPFYITNDPVGGYYHKSPEERKNIEIYAGVRRSRSGELIPTGVGRSCIWTPDTNGAEADEYPSFGAYQRSLTLVCESGNPGVVTWTPDNNTPDTVYYQCFTHRYLGWKINVVDSCDEQPAESRVQESVLPPPGPPGPPAPPSDQVQQESVQVATRVRPDDLNSLTRTKLEKIMHTKHHDFSSDRTSEEIVSTGQMRDVIRAVESLESHQYRVHEPSEQSEQHEQHEQGALEGAGVQVAGGGARLVLPLAAGARPLTLQAVLRPGAPRPPLRRPAPPSLTLRRPPPPPHYPLPLPSHHKHHDKHYNKQYYNKFDKPSFERIPVPNNRPMKPMAQKHRPPVKKLQSGPIQAIVFGKPGPAMKVPPPPAPQQTHTLSLGRTELVVDKVVKSQITLPSDSMGSSSVQNSFVHRQPPGQIILGKPMDHPVPLDQQMTPTEHRLITAPPTPPPEVSPTPSFSPPSRNEPQRPSLRPQQEIESSDFLGESPDPSTLQPAVNTGFKPNTIVIESGFKPIIREPLMDRVGGDYEVGEDVNRRQDTDVEEDYQESPQPIANHAYEKPSDQQPLSFEPMFIPSPPDLLLPTNDRTKEVFPSNHAKEDRPHPVYVKTESELNALFGKKNMEKNVPSDMVMESDRISPHYLPPDPKLPKEHSQKLAMNDDTFTSYDGKIVSAATLTSVPDSKPVNKIFSSKLPANSELLLRTPQFGPFKGEIPPAVAGSIANAGDDKTVTHLKLINVSVNKDDDITPEGSENHEVAVKKGEEEELVTKEVDENPNKITEEKKHENKKDVKDELYDPETSDEEEEEDDEDDTGLDVRRQKRDVKTTSDTVKDQSLTREQRGTKQVEFQPQTISSAVALQWMRLGILPLPI